uniref:Uncharacterized protein n=1 Tax=Triticum urartu TaxID=4572 RepID=A0A8R7V790_TRIUA
MWYLYTQVVHTWCCFCTTKEKVDHLFFLWRQPNMAVNFGNKKYCFS